MIHTCTLRVVAMGMTPHHGMKRHETLPYGFQGAGFLKPRFIGRSPMGIGPSSPAGGSGSGGGFVEVVSVVFVASHGG